MGVVGFAEKWPVLGRHEVAAGWLRIWADLGRAPRTIDAYARGLAEYLDVCERENVDPATASRAHVAVFVRELTSRPSRRGPNVVSIDSGAGLSNATIQQRLVPVRLFYDHLIEEGLRDSNPVGRGKYTPGRKFGGHERGLVPRLVKLPWIPDERQWAAVLRTAADEPVRNRVMLALAYDAALRREELCLLGTEDVDPGRRTLRVKAENTKNRMERVVPYSAPTGVLLSSYLAHRAKISRARGPVFLSESRRNYGQPVTLWDLVEGRAADRGRFRGGAVLHAYHQAPVPDRPGPDGLGTARHLGVRRPQVERVDAPLYPPVRPRPRRQAQPGHAAHPRLAGRDARPPRRAASRGALSVTGASSAAAVGAAGPSAWPWPVDLERYPRQGLLSVTELDGLRALGLELLRRADRDLGSAPWRAVRKLVQPLDDARSALHWHPDTRHQRRFARDAAALVLARCAELGRSYLTWPAQDWADLIGTGAGGLRQSWPGQVGSSARPYLLAYAYLLGGFTAFNRVGRFHRQSLASRVFGKDLVDDAVGQVRGVLAGWGYHRRCERELTAVTCHVLLLNRSPRLEDLSGEALARLRADPAMGRYFPGDLHGVHRALAALGHAEPPAAPRYGDGRAVITGAADAWAGWVERWHATSTLAPVTRGIYRVVLAKTGRWLAGEHPEITEPAHWTRQTCASWVAAVDRMAVGDYSQSLAGKRGRVGEPLSPKPSQATCGWPARSSATCRNGSGSPAGSTRPRPWELRAACAP